MEIWLIILLSVIAFLVAGFFVALFVVYRMSYFNTVKGKVPDDQPIRGRQYEPFYPEIYKLYDSIRPYGKGVRVEIKSFDGKKMVGSLFEGDPHVVDILVHGYRSNGLRDMAGALSISQRSGHTALVIDQRGCGRSDGRAETFGVKERRDVKAWIDWVNQRYDHPQIVLAGVSLGAATVLMTLSLDLPENVKGVVADCPFESPKAILLHVSHKMGIPDGLSWFLLRGAARVYAHCNPIEMSAIEAVKMSKVPVLLIHGDDDHYVPHEHSIHIHEQDPERIRLEIFPGAPHGLSFILDEERYRNAVNGFYNQILE